MSVKRLQLKFPNLQDGATDGCLITVLSYFCWFCSFVQFPETPLWSHSLERTFWDTWQSSVGIFSLIFIVLQRLRCRRVQGSKARGRGVGWWRQWYGKYADSPSPLRPGFKKVRFQVLRLQDPCGQSAITRAATIHRRCRQKSITEIVDNEFHGRQLSPDVFFQRSEASHYIKISAESHTCAIASLPALSA